MKYKVKLSLLVILAISCVSPGSANQTPSEDGLLDQIRKRNEVVRPPSGRAVMVNPYDEVALIQEAQKSGTDDNANAIEALSIELRNDVGNPDTVIRGQITRLLRSPVKIDTEAAMDLLNLDSGTVEVDKIPAVGRDEMRRDWLVPSISMLQSGDTSIGEPENSFLKNWELIRNNRGEHTVGRIGDPISKIRVRVGMIFGEYGRITAVRDTPDAYYLILESGDRIRGRAGVQYE